MKTKDHRTIHTAHEPTRTQPELSRRAVFVLHELDGFTCEEIARTLEIPIGTSYSRLRLARQDFSAAMHRFRARKANL